MTKAFFGGSMSYNYLIYPTDTVWGIGGDALDIEVYKRIAQIKETDVAKPLSLLFSNLDQVNECLDLSSGLESFIEQASSLGVTFGIPKSLFRLPLPEQPFLNTDYICIRLVRNTVTRELENVSNFPIISTSLNKTGQQPISNLEEAKTFWKKYASDFNFIEPDHRLTLSGASSTIVFLSADRYKIVREGTNVLKIIEILKKIGFNEQ